MPTKNLPHPGCSIRIARFEPLGPSVTQGAEIPWRHPANTKKCRQRQVGISPEMAIRLSKAFGSTPETWLRMQLAYDLARPEKTGAKSRFAVSMGFKSYRHGDGGRVRAIGCDEGRSKAPQP